jgi:DNA repair exonuclease SbcCD nuclease subunit
VRVPKLVHAADLHLDSPLVGLERYEGAPAGELRRATRGALERLVELCVNEGAELLLIAGDLFDGNWRDYSTGLFLCERMARLREAGVRVVWLRGNHDAASRLRKHLRLPENVRELSHARPESVSFEDLNLVVHGQGFSEPAVLEDLTRRYPAAVAGAVNVGLLHTALVGRPGHDPYAPCTLSALVDRGYDYWALGHVHAHEIVHRAPFVVYPGNLQGRQVRESGPKGAVVVTFDSAKVTGVEHRALDVVRWAKVTVDVASALTLDDVGDAVQRALVRESVLASERLLAARVELVGASALHAALKADPERVAQTVRAAALDVDAGPVWVERAVVGTRAERLDFGDGISAAGPLGELARELSVLRAEPAALAAFVAELPALSELFRKYRPAPGAETAIEPGTLLEDARELLLARLAELESG